MGNQETYKEVTTQSWGSRIKGSIKSVLLGIILFLLAFVVLWFNEGRAVKTAKGLTEGASQVISINAQELSNENSGKLVHISGKVITDENIKDNEFNIDVNALKLRRHVLMFQWVENKEQKKEKELGGSEKTTTIYNYEKKWEESIIESNKFKVTEGHSNPQNFPYSKYTHTVSKASIGKFNLPGSLLSGINSFVPYAVTAIDTLKYKNAKIINEGNSNLSQKIFIGKGTPASPQIGDVKVSFEIVKSGEDYSIVSKQVGNTFEPYQTSTGTSIELITKGIHSSEHMFASAQRSNTIITWVLRLVGFFMMFIGLSLLFKPLVVLADVLPFLGRILDFGLSLFSGLISFGLSAITIAIAWIVYRPILGISLLVIGIGIAVFLFVRKSKNKKEINN